MRVKRGLPSRLLSVDLVIMCDAGGDIVVTIAGDPTPLPTRRRYGCLWTTLGTPATDLLPIPENVLDGGESELTPREEALRGDFIYEPEPEEILERLLPVYLETEIYRALLESATSFLAAQMTAMRNASKNAGELIDTYTLQMNRARQAQITQEILEIVAGADALTQ